MSLSGSLPKKRMAAGALLFNTSQQILLVKPVYRTGWLLPGGVVEDGESPRQACMREIKEELGLEVAVGRLLCVDYKVPHPRREEGIEFVFWGGVLEEERIGQIRLQAQELEAFQCVPVEEAITLLNPWSARRIPFAMQAQREGITLYLEDGQSVS
jgi:8-oxo-dGTP diphosphatase